MSASARPSGSASATPGPASIRGSLEATVDGRSARATLRSGIVTVSTAGLAVGEHRLRVELADYQETRNMENVARILPNTRVVSARVTVARR